MPEHPLPVVLVVDDASTGRTFLRALLKRAGYAVETAASGEEALAVFVPGKFDVVFMDIRMPGINGIEATRAIKAMSAEIFTPVIFVTGEDDEDVLVEAIAAGGDDFLTKPVTPAILLAKLQAMARIRVVHERTRRLYTRVIEDQEFARQVFDRAVGRRAVVSSDLTFRLIPAEVFSGDILLSALSPQGQLYVLFGDFTGHGLAAALGAMPVADAFRVMVEHEYPVERILGELNRKVAEALPRGNFLAASLIMVERNLTGITVANCGMPALLLCGPQGVRERISSATFALGILEDAKFGDAVRSLPIEPGERLVIASDGISEACNAEGAAFGEERLEALLATDCRDSGGTPAMVIAAMDRFRGAAPLSDDASIAEIRFTETLFDGCPPRTETAGSQLESETI